MQSFLELDFSGLWNTFIWPRLSVRDAAVLAQCSTGLCAAVCDLVTQLSRPALAALLENRRLTTITRDCPMHLFMTTLFKEKRFLIYTYPPWQSIECTERTIISPNSPLPPSNDEEEDADRIIGTVIFHTVPSLARPYTNDYDHAYRAPMFPVIDAAMRLCCARLAYEQQGAAYRTTKRRRIE